MLFQLQLGTDRGTSSTYNYINLSHIFTIKLKVKIDIKRVNKVTGGASCWECFDDASTADWTCIYKLKEKNY